MKRIYFYLVILFAPVMGVAQSVNPSFAGLKKINGVNLYFEIYGEGQPLLIIHGGPGMNHDYFLPYMLTLAKKYKLIFYDQRACGRSEIPEDTLTGTSYANMINDIEGIRKAFNIDKLNILAHSWGAVLAINYALKNGNHTRSLILSDPISLSHEFDSAQQQNIKERWKDTMLAFKSKEIKRLPEPTTSIRIKLAFLSAMYDVRKIDSINVTMPRNVADALTVLYRGLMSDAEQYDRDYYTEIKAIHTPTLIIHGDYDNVVLASSEKLKASIAHSKLVRFDKSGHFPFLEENAKYTETVFKFLDGLK